MTATLIDAGLALTIFFGLCLGSLATALAHRLPRAIPMTTPRSRCPRCGCRLGALDLIPVVSWLWLRGRCRGCGQAYGVHYLLIELVTLTLCLAFFVCLPTGAWLLAFYCAAAVLVAHTAIDLESQLLMDSLNLALAVLAFAAIILIGPLQVSALMPVLAFAGAGVVLYALASAGLRWLAGKVLRREAMGLGDVKFFAAAGAWLGPDPAVLAHFMLIAGLSGIVLGLLWRRRFGDEAFPFGPALIFALIALLLAGQGLVAGRVYMYGNVL